MLASFGCTSDVARAISPYRLLTGVGENATGALPDYAGVLYMEALRSGGSYQLCCVSWSYPPGVAAASCL
jgi:hypothetical protein